MFHWTGGSSSSIRKRLPKKIIGVPLQSTLHENKKEETYIKEKKEKEKYFIPFSNIDEITGSINSKRTYAKKKHIEQSKREESSVKRKKQIIDADIYIPERTKEQNEEIEMIDDMVFDDELDSCDFGIQKKNIIKVERKDVKKPRQIKDNKPNAKLITSNMHIIFNKEPDRINIETQI